MLSLPFFTEEHRSLAARAREIATRVVEPRADDADGGDVAAAGRDFIAAFAAERLLDTLIPPVESGRSKPDLRSLCLVREALARASGVADSVYAVHGLGSFPILTWGSDELKARYLPEMAGGRPIGAFALTEPQAGSDVAGIETTASLEGTHYVLDGRKTLISNAGIAGCYVVFAAVSGHETASKRPLVALVVDAATRGLHVSTSIRLMAPHPIGELLFERCRVPIDQRLGGEADGMRVALSTLDFFRTSVGAAACGMAGRALDEARQRALARRQFGRPIAEFQTTQLALADMQTELDAARLLVYRAAWVKDQGAARVTSESSIAKLFATEAAQRVIDRAVQIHGGVGVTRGVVVERLYREIRAMRIYEGTSEIQRLVIAGQLLKPRDPTRQR